MSDETEAGTQTLDSSSKTIESGFRQESEKDSQGIETSADELTLRLVDERIKQATDPILRRVKELCALLASGTEMESTGISEASGSRRNKESVSPSRNRHDGNIKLSKDELQVMLLLYRLTLHNFARFELPSGGVQSATLVDLYK